MNGDSTAPVPEPELTILEETPIHSGYFGLSVLRWKPNVEGAQESTYNVFRARTGIAAIAYDAVRDKVMVQHELRPTMLCLSPNDYRLLGPDAERPTGRMWSVTIGGVKGEETFLDALRREMEDETDMADLGRIHVLGDIPLGAAMMPSFVRAYVVEFDSTEFATGMRTGDRTKGEDIVTEIMSVDDLTARLKSADTIATAMDATSQTVVLRFLLNREEIRGEWVS